MRRRTASLIVVMCALVALFALPAMAQAVPSIIGTVTVSGVATEGVSVELYRYDTGDAYWWSYDGTISGVQGAFAFDVSEGKYFLRASSADGVMEAVSEVMVVGGADAKSVSLALVKEANAPRITNWEQDGGYSADSWASDDVKFWIEADDTHSLNDLSFRGSGAKSLFFSINRGPFVESTMTAEGSDEMGVSALKVDSSRVSAEGTVTTSGINTVTYYAVDKNGNASKMRTKLVYIDKSAPVTGYDMKAATGSSIVLIPTDSGAGVAGTFWRIGGTGAFNPGNWVPVPATGMATVEFYSVDKVGNIEAVKSMTIQPKAGMTKPKASTKSPKASKTFYVRGAVVGKTSAAGTLRVYKLVNGKYKYVAKKSFKESSAGTYKVALKLKKGTYKFKAFYGANTATASNPPANSVYSARSVVK